MFLKKFRYQDYVVLLIHKAKKLRSVIKPLYLDYALFYSSIDLMQIGIKIKQGVYPQMKSFDWSNSIIAWFSNEKLLDMSNHS